MPQPLSGSGQDVRVFGLTTVRIVGPSMEPALRNGEVYLAKAAHNVRVVRGDVVVVVHPQRNELLTVKRLVRRTEDGWWVEGDNPVSSSDSREFGPVPEANIRAKILIRLRPLRR
jgi:nickel-type superoxide dismutase maturation protease